MRSPQPGPNLAQRIPVEGDNQEPLPSWYDRGAKQSIVDFVENVTKEQSPDYVPESQRIAAFGNSDGELHMLEWTASGQGRRFCMLVHHTDAELEWAYDPESHVGRLDKAWDQAEAPHWTVVDVKADWVSVFPESGSA